LQRYTKKSNSYLKNYNISLCFLTLLQIINIYYYDLYVFIAIICNFGKTVIIMVQLTTPLSNLQLELLKLYVRNVSQEDLLQIKYMLARYFAQKATDLADKVWVEKQLDAETILQTHIRTPYKK
jgi:hypothetical protein